MIKIILKNGIIKKFNKEITIKDVIKSISNNKEYNESAIAGIINNKIYDLNYLIKKNSNLEILTTKESDFFFKVINHTASIITAKALFNIYKNDINIINIIINDNGFFLDFKNNKFNILEKDLSKIEEEVLFLIKKNITIKELEIDFLSFKNIFNKNKYILNKIENNENIKIDCYLIEDTYFYKYNKYIIIKNNFIKKYKILNLSGIYLDNNSNNEMIQRINCIAYDSEEKFNNFFEIINKKKLNDHRKIGKELEIFTFNKLIGPGLPIWLPNGLILKKEIQNFIRNKELEYGFIEVETPLIATDNMYKISGHWEHYQENMFPSMQKNNEVYILRPMSCPHHIAVYNFKKRSYKDLPLRISEHAILHRYETSGGLTGLERVRMMQLTDSHIFVSHNQIKNEFKNCFKLILEVLKDFNIILDNFSLSLRDIKNKDKYFKNDEIWNNSEKILKESLKELKINYLEKIGDAAFYGPKLDFQIKTVLDHEITISTIQLDFLLPNKFDIWFINNLGKKERPIIIHRGLIGTYERFISILLEQNKGVLPLWLAPCQIIIIPLFIDKHLNYSNKIFNKLKKLNFRCSINSDNNRLSYKIRESQKFKIPYQIVIGDYEIENKIITYREYGNEIKKSIKINDFIKILFFRIKNKI